MAMLGKIDMNNPRIVFGCFEERTLRSDVNDIQLIVATDSRRTSKDSVLLQVYFGRLVCSHSLSRSSKIQ